MKTNTPLFSLKIHDGGKPLKLEDVRHLVPGLASNLPRDYHEFLTAQNGGRFYAPVSYIMPANPYTNEIGHFSFFGLYDPSDDMASDLRLQVKLYEGRLPIAMLPIGDAGDDLLMLGLNVDRPGMFLWVRDWELDDDASRNFVHVANSFEDFAGGCRINPDGFSNSETLEPFKAVEQFDIVELKRLFDKADISGNATNEHGEPLLCCACLHLNYEAAQLLLERGAKANVAGRQRGFSPLYLAAAAGAIDLMNLLVKHGAHGRMIFDPSLWIYNALYPPPPARVMSVLRKLAE